MKKTRNPVIAFFLSIVPGLGQIYNGQITKGLFFLLFDILFPIAFALSGLLLNLTGLVSALIVTIVFLLYRMWDGLTVARRLKEIELTIYNKWYLYVIYFVVIFCVRLYLDAPTSTGIQTYKIITSSMSPTLLQGDWVVADIKEYDNHAIQYGDIVVYRSLEKKTWTHRVIGLPNDTIEIVDGEVFINGKLNRIQKLGETISEGKEVIKYNEELVNSKHFETFRFKEGQLEEALFMDKKLIPQNEYFLMGDNRDNAYDSRFLGTIKRSDILGHVIYGYWGKTTDRINIELRVK